MAHEHPNKLHTVGCPAPGHDIRLIDDWGREVSPGGTGEIVGHSMAMMNSYHHLPTATENAEWRDTSRWRTITALGRNACGVRSLEAGQPVKGSDIAGVGECIARQNTAPGSGRDRGCTPTKSDWQGA